jgi:capsular polysaccharide biosynthesis protein
VSVVPLDDIRVQSLAPPLTQRFSPLVRIAIALAAGVGLAALAEYLDRSVRTQADVEALGLPVLAQIPREDR